jgi:hypothetical protein
LTVIEGDTEVSEKVLARGALTAKVPGVLAVTTPSVPTSWNGYVPGVSVLRVLMCKEVLCPPPAGTLSVVLPKLHVAPAGNP